MLVSTTNNRILPSTTSKRLTLVALSLGFGIVQLDVTVVNVAIKQIGSGLHSGVSAMQWVISAYTLAFAALIRRAIFFINLPIGVVGMWLTARFSNETPAHKHQLDLPGQLAGIVALGALATATIEGGDVGWTSAVALGGYAVFALAAGAFL